MRYTDRLVDAGNAPSVGSQGDAYDGLDPIFTEEEGRDFRYVHGVGEYLPFRSATFSFLVVKAALDHFRDINRFFEEAVRVLTTEGRVHLLQSVHDVTGPRSAVKTIAHRIKDALDSRATNREGLTTPKHMAEFEQGSLLGALRSHFKVVATREHSSGWHAPRILFASLEPLKLPSLSTAASTTPSTRSDGVVSENSADDLIGS